MTTITWLAGVSVLRPESLSISADKIAAGAITADKLVIEPETSLPWPEPSFSGFSRSQIQVWVEDRLVGYLEGDLRLGYGKVNEFRDDYGIMRPVKVREAELSRFELLSRDDEIRAIAEFCEKEARRRRLSADRQPSQGLDPLQMEYDRGLPRRI